MHSVAYVGDTPMFYNKLIRTLVALVAAELVYIKIDHASPEGLQHTHQLLELTLMRPLRTHGRVMEPEYVEALTHILNRQKAAIVSMLNGDWRLPRLQHNCVYDPIAGKRCCANRGDAVGKVTYALIEAFFVQLGSTQPSAIKWYTFEMTMTLQGGGICCHGTSEDDEDGIRGAGSHRASSWR